jgi:hypothetical protein
LDAEIQAVIERKAHGRGSYVHGMDMHGDEEKIGHLHNESVTLTSPVEKTII